MTGSYKDFFEKAQKTKGVTRGPVVAKRTKKGGIKSPRRSPNKTLVALTLLGFVVTFVGTWFFEDIEKLLGRIEITAFSRAGAAETEKPNPESTQKDGKTANKETSSGKNNSSDNSSAVQAPEDAPRGGSETSATEDVELDHFARLKERKVELDRREEMLNKIEAELNQQRQEVETKLKELEQVRRSISSVLEEKVQTDEQKVENLIQFYSNMKPAQAAKIIETIDEDLAMKVITGMKKKNAADIMNLLKPEKAQSISEKYVGYRK